MFTIIVLIGAPGAGKGTQSRLLEERLALPHISTGDMFRAIRKQRTPLAEEVRAVMDAGRLISDDLVIRVVRDRTGQPDCEHGYILDGFPRTKAQARMLEELALEQGKRIEAFFIDVPFDLIEKRAMGRRDCPVCGRIYNIYFRPPKFDCVCDLHPESKLSVRADDTAGKIKVRLRTYNQETRPILDYYEATHHLHRLDGTREPEAVYADILAVIDSGDGPADSPG
jgi:adenylate kinase